MEVMADKIVLASHIMICLLYTSDAADDMQCVDLGGRRIIKKTLRASWIASVVERVVRVLTVVLWCFFKQKTAYEM